MIIRILKGSTQDDADSGEEETIEVEAIDLSRTTAYEEVTKPPLTMPAVKLLAKNVGPIEPFDPGEPDSYYARNVGVTDWRDGIGPPMDIPHYIGLRVVLESILDKYGESDFLVKIG